MKTKSRLNLFCGRNVRSVAKFALGRILRSVEQYSGQNSRRTKIDGRTTVVGGPNQQFDGNVKWLPTGILAFRSQSAIEALYYSCHLTKRQLFQELRNLKNQDASLFLFILTQLFTGRCLFVFFRYCVRYFAQMGSTVTLRQERLTNTLQLYYVTTMYNLYLAKRGILAIF